MSHLTEVNENMASPSPDVATSDDSNDYFKLPFRLLELLDQSQAIVAEVFVEFDFGESLPAPSGMAAYNCLTSYLILWRLILTLDGWASSELRLKYSEIHPQRESHGNTDAEAISSHDTRIL
jgi:hypothetical protein